jgi:hypothetical protein
LPGRCDDQAYINEAGAAAPARVKG